MPAVTIQRAGLRTISTRRWGEIVRAWNSGNAHARRAAAARCRQKGHILAACPIGPFCTRCCSYFPDDRPSQPATPHGSA